jgi:hypothetical protein
MPCPIIDAELRIMDHRMDFHYFFYFFQNGSFWAPKNFEKEFLFLFVFCFFSRLARREKKEAVYLLRAKSGPIGALTSSQKRRTRAALAPESIFKLMTSARDYGRSELSGELLSRWW